MIDKSCDYCGVESPTNKHYDPNSGRVFCSLAHFQKYHLEHNFNQVIQSHELLNQAQILDLQAQSLSFHTAIEGKSIAEQLRLLERRILDQNIIIASYKLSITLDTRRIMKIRSDEESEKVERYRKAGVNSDLELKNKLETKLAKMIASYKKMNMTDDWILSTIPVISQGKFTREQVEAELKNFKT